MSVRTDTHSPLNLITEDYEYIYAYDSGQPGCLVGTAQTEWWQDIVRNRASVHPQGQCDHCGAHLRYIAILKHTPTGQYLEVGETCLDNRFNRATAEFHALRKQAQLDREQQRILEAVAEFHATHPEVDWDKLAASENTFVADVLRKLRRYGSISPRQLEAIQAAVVRDEERAARRAEREANPVAKVTVPEGKQTLTGKIVSIKPKTTDYGTTLKITVVVTTPEGEYAVWGTLPKALDSYWDEAFGGYKAVADVGDTVRFSATVTRSDRDPSFGFFKRPTKAEVVGTPEVAATVVPVPVPAPLFEVVAETVITDPANRAAAILDLFNSVQKGGDA